MTPKCYASRQRGGRLVLLAASLFTLSAQADTLRVLVTGLGAGQVTSVPAGINCSTSGGACEFNFPAGSSVALTAMSAGGSIFAGWSVEAEPAAGSTAHCGGTAPCMLTMNGTRSLRPRFDPDPANALTRIPPLTTATTGAILPATIQAYLTSNPQVDTPAEFLAALPEVFRAGAILMTRSESLQTGTADFPRILVFNNDAKSVFSFGVATHSSYPGSHPLAVEYMQWDEPTQNFRFHEIVLGPIPALPAGASPPTFEARSRGVAVDDRKCTSCHSTRNVPNVSSVPGTDGDPPRTILVKNKPNWDPYDSWAGMLPFNRDRLYKGSLEAAAYRRLMNPWTWRDAPEIRALIEQLRLQPVGVPSNHVVTRWLGGALDGTPRFPFDAGGVPPSVEPAPTGTLFNINYAFNGVAGAGAGTPVLRGKGISDSPKDYVTLFHPSQTSDSDEGRGVQLFDLLNGFGSDPLNPKRIADELKSHFWATGNHFVDARPIALGILKGCLSRDSGLNRVELGGAALAAGPEAFFLARNAGVRINGVFTDTQTRTQSIPHRKVDLQRRNLDRSADPYRDTLAGADPAPGLIPTFGARTSAGTSATLTRVRQEVFQRPRDLGVDAAILGAGVFVDREIYGNTETVALFRYLLEPLGVSVDKWSLGVRGRSRAYAFADVFSLYEGQLTTQLEASLGMSTCAQLQPAIEAAFNDLPAANDVPTYTDIQRIFNKACIECHGGLNYPPYSNYGTYLDFSEDVTAAQPMLRSHTLASGMATYLLSRVESSSLTYPGGSMPFEGPKLSEVDIETLRRWIGGSTPYTWGDPHLKTVSGEEYDFQAAGEFTLLRDLDMELQARFTPVQTEQPVYDDHTDLSVCASITTAIAVRIGENRVTYQMPVEKGDGRMELRINGERIEKWGDQLVLAGGGRIVRTAAQDGIQIETNGGTRVRVTPHHWAYYDVWYLDLHLERARGTQGVLGKVSVNNWLPALPDGGLFGPRPADAGKRYAQLYEKFADAWRVTDKSSLFDYPWGWTTREFTLEGWPGFKPDQCRVENPPPGIPVKEPLKPISFKEAWALCGKIEDEKVRELCAQDVAATGDPIFAEGYLETLAVLENAPPGEAIPIYPKDYGTTEGKEAIFEWKEAFDPNQDRVTYRLCVWSVNEGFTAERCAREPTPETKAVVPLEGGRAWFWKVLTEDGKGGVSESATRQVTVK